MTEQTHTSAAPAKLTIAFIGLGQMGQPMAKRLLGAGFTVHGADLSEPARATLTAAGGVAFANAAEAVIGADVIITMLPDGRIVREVLIGAKGIASGLPENTLIIDMSSSEPLGTASLGEELAEMGLRLVDAPVSGGVRRAIDGSLSIMAGGKPEDVAEAQPILQPMAKSIFATGKLGSGHAVKALNNYVSAAGLVAAAEAVIVGKRFGIDPDILVDVLNASTGRNNSTEVKLKQFMISETFASGFSLALMAKDLRTAAGLASNLDVAVPQIQSIADMWDAARATLQTGADHTEISRYLDKLASERD